VPAALKTRFAPSPTGRLHLGNARTALFNALLARAAGGVFLLRVEDTDAERSRPEYLDALAEDLAWLGLRWDEGYGSGGDAGPYRQSERGPIYAGLLGRLEAEGRAYPCFCSPERLQAVRRAQLARGAPPRYDGACAGLPAAEAQRRLAAGEAAALRFRIPAGETVGFDDLVRGAQRFDSDAIGDFVLRRGDGSPAFFFSNAVDDALMAVSHVLRGEDHLSNTPRQLLILTALGLAAPRYGHLPLILEESGAPLSKREGSLSLAALREQGYRPLAVVNYLARLGHHYPDDGFLGLDALAGQFRIASLGVSPARFELAQLRHWQHLALTHEPPGAIWDWMGPGVRRCVPPAAAGPFVEALRGNVLAPAQAEDWARRLFEERPSLEPAAREALAAADPRLFPAAVEALAAAPTDYTGFVAGIRGRTGLAGKALFRPLRAALTGTHEGPELARLFDLLGEARVRARLRAAADFHQES
jgi:glutamyl-tRNA synthetase